MKILALTINNLNNFNKNVKDINPFNNPIYEEGYSKLKSLYTLLFLDIEKIYYTKKFNVYYDVLIFTNKQDELYISYSERFSGFMDKYFPEYKY